MHEEETSGRSEPAAGAPSRAAGRGSPLDAIWRQEAALVARIVEEVRALRLGLHGLPAGLAREAAKDRPAGALPQPMPRSAADAPGPVALARLAPVDPVTGDRLAYEIVDADGYVISHLDFELVGNELRLRPNAAIPEGDSGCASLHLAVTSATGERRIEEYVVRLPAASVGRA